VAQVLLAIEERLIAAMAAGRPETDAASVLRHMWHATADPRMAPLVRALFETWGRALVRPGEFGDYLERIFTPWRDALATGLETAEPADVALAKATLALAAFNGLQLVRLTTGDVEQANAAFDLMTRQILETES
jgi:hypothetical protein